MSDEERKVAKPFSLRISFEEALTRFVRTKLSGLEKLKKLRSTDKKKGEKAVAGNSAMSNADPEEHVDQERSHKQCLKFGTAIATIVLYGLFVYGDLEVIFPKSHFYGVAVLFICACALIYLEFFQSGLIKIRGWLIFCGAAAVICVLILFCIGPTPEPSPEIGWLQPANVPTPANACSRVATKDAVIVLYGNNASFYVKSAVSPFAKHTILQIGDCPSLVVRSGEDGVYIDAYIYDKAGDLLGKISDNKFVIQNDKSLHIERTGDLSTLIVHNEKSQEILYVKYLNENAFKIRGEFYCPIPLKGYFNATSSNKNFANNCFGNAGKAAIQVGPR